ncbi:MAG TPA: glycosyltransferase family 2 protein [Hyphomonas atlantica]|nr:glycosyltransferase family 2 protein [Hyphomonas atlantica]
MENDTVTQISVLIVNFNGEGYLQAALDSLRAQTFQDFEIIVVDNNSTDGSADELSVDGLSKFRLLKQDKNLGFAAASNIGVKAAKSPWVAMLNPDAEAKPDWLANILDGIKRHPGVSMFSCAQLCLEDSSVLDGAGDNYLAFGIPWRGGFGRSLNDLPREGECFSPCGASAVFFRDTYLSHGGLDERFFCYCEDVDLGYRMRLAGERCIFLPTAVVSHAGSGISGRASEFSLFHGTRNRLWTYAKNTPFALLCLTLPGHVLLTIAILMRGTMKGRAGPVWRGLVAGVAGIARIRADRTFGPPRRVVPLVSLMRAMAWDPRALLGRHTVVTPLKNVEAVAQLDAVRS